MCPGKVPSSPSPFSPSSSSSSSPTPPLPSQQNALDPQIKEDPIAKKQKDNTYKVVSTITVKDRKGDPHTFKVTHTGIKVTEGISEEDMARQAIEQAKEILQSNDSQKVLEFLCSRSGTEGRTVSAGFETTKEPSDKKFFINKKGKDSAINLTGEMLDKKIAKTGAKNQFYNELLNMMNDQSKIPKDISSETKKKIEKGNTLNSKDLNEIANALDIKYSLKDSSSKQKSKEEEKLEFSDDEILDLNHLDRKAAKWQEKQKNLETIQKVSKSASSHSNKRVGQQEIIGQNLINSGYEEFRKGNEEFRNGREKAEQHGEIPNSEVLQKANKHFEKASEHFEKASKYFEKAEGMESAWGAFGLANLYCHDYLEGNCYDAAEQKLDEATKLLNGDKTSPKEAKNQLRQNMEQLRSNIEQARTPPPPLFAIFQLKFKFQLEL